MHSDEGYLLSFVKVGDYDAVVHIFSQNSGYQSFFSKSVFKSRRGKKALLKPLQKVEFSYSTRHSSLAYLSRFEAKASREFSVKANLILFFAADLLNDLLRDEQQNIAVYTAVEEFLRQLEGRNYSAHYLFIFKLIEIFGILPLSGSGDFLDPERGIFSAEQSSTLFSAEVSEIWKRVLDAGIDYAEKIPIQKKEALLESLLVFLSYHQGIRIPKSLEVIKQMTE
ncbi:recombination protein O N-terminal domain-containing protein [Cruoricaptor ignavus]|uniref:Recombination protein O N-terminal domain-containing protein n=1 Tax=Cruoricaptor ignavus TaxID=1118202 RepID=A0A7M1T116_9FLAO|nr:recombination protein O N-terminal domain-containing protein [Cruoricaptor ignavus]QOR73520.1 recombination protein O N-terminal domain-containing protein [Cruoricaptor ignavus]